MPSLFLFIYLFALNIYLFDYYDRFFVLIIEVITFNVCFIDLFDLLFDRLIVLFICFFESLMYLSSLFFIYLLSLFFYLSFTYFIYHFGFSTHLLAYSYSFNLLSASQQTAKRLWTGT